MNRMRRMERRDNTPTRSTICKGSHSQVHLRAIVKLKAVTNPNPNTTHFQASLPSLQNTYMKEKFMIKIETWHKPDLGDQENVHGLDKSKWETVDVVNIDIADKSCINAKDYKADEDPAIFKSQKTGRGPLGPDWRKELANNSNCPHMCAYKLVTVEFKWLGLQNRMETLIHKVERRLFTQFHRQLFCWIDKWIDLSLDDIRHWGTAAGQGRDDLS
uniref:Phosphatidylinositol transfer protein alpha isoform n=1 Tax=Nothobranchius furzeri TaxID=105023 RepID=A0A8C6PGS5_NOTFU